MNEEAEKDNKFIRKTLDLTLVETYNLNENTFEIFESFFNIATEGEVINLYKFGNGGAWCKEINENTIKLTKNSLDFYSKDFKSINWKIDFKGLLFPKFGLVYNLKTYEPNLYLSSITLNKFAPEKRIFLRK